MVKNNNKSFQHIFYYFFYDNPDLGPLVRKFIERQEGGDPTEASIFPIEALSLIMDRDLSKEDYNAIFTMFKKFGIGIPCYDKVKDVKLECRPEGIVTSIEDIQVPLQNMAEHRIKRILQLEDVKARIIDCIDRTGGPLVLVYNIKIGLDGSSGFQVIQKLNVLLAMKALELYCQKLPKLKALELVILSPLVFLCLVV